MITLTQTLSELVDIQVEFHKRNKSERPTTTHVSAINIHETDSDEDISSIGSSQLDETDVLNFVDTMPFNNDNSNDIKIFNDLEEHLKCIGHLAYIFKAKYYPT